MPRNRTDKRIPMSPVEQDVVHLALTRLRRSIKRKDSADRSKAGKMGTPIISNDFWLAMIDNVLNELPEPPMR